MDSRNRPSTDDWVDRQLAARQTPIDWVPDTAGALTRFRQRLHTKASMGIKIAWISTGAAALTIAALSFPPTRILARDCAQACFAGTSRTIQFVLDQVKVGSEAKPIIAVERQVAPDFALMDAQGRSVQLSALRGRVVLLNFWATWCKPCGVEIPWFIDLQRNYGERGLSVVGISVDDDGWKAVTPYIAALRINYPVMIGGESIIRRYGGLDSLPTTLLIDRNGRVAVTHVGLVSRRTYETGIVTILSE
ncbi:MAG: TlpA family protein disulfide reductase [Bryobacteraceae bacterium]|nr:TlpA family protein disulfide reductase [Bryobacteraceae bacterium]